MAIWWNMPNAQLTQLLEADKAMNPLPQGSPLNNQHPLTLTTGNLAAGIPLGQPRSITVDANTFDRMVETHHATWLTHALIPYGSANNLAAVVAGNGAAARRAFCWTQLSPEPKSYSRNGLRDLETVSWGTGVCTQINSLLFRIAVELAKEKEAQAQEDNSGTTQTNDKPMMLVTNGKHVFFQSGDVRQPGAVVDGCAWVDLPTVQLHEESVFNHRPIRILDQYITGASGFNDFSLSEAIHHPRISDAEISDELTKRGHNLPLPGPNLLQGYKATLLSIDKVQVWNVTYSTKSLNTVYQDNEGKNLRFNQQPVDHYKKMMATYTNPAYRSLKTELEEKGLVERG